MKDAPDLLSPKEAAAFLRLSPATIHKLKGRGELKYIRMAGRIMYRREELLDFVERSERQEPTVTEPEVYDDE